jgi:hypothetical protein
VKAKMFYWRLSIQTSNVPCCEFFFEMLESRECLQLFHFPRRLGNSFFQFFFHSSATSSLASIQTPDYEIMVEKILTAIEAKCACYFTFCLFFCNNWWLLHGGNEFLLLRDRVRHETIVHCIAYLLFFSSNTQECCVRGKRRKVRTVTAPNEVTHLLCYICTIDNRQHGRTLLHNWFHSSQPHGPKPFHSCCTSKLGFMYSSFCALL